MADPYEYTESVLKRWGPGGTAYEGATRGASSPNDEIANLEQEIAQLNAMRQKPYVTSISSSASPVGEPEGWPKTSRQIELENKLAELVRKRNATVESEAGDRAGFEGRVAGQLGSEEEEAAPEQPGTAEKDVTPPPDPLEPARGRGAQLDDLLAFSWPGTQDAYVSANLERLLRIASTRAAEKRILHPRHVFDVLLHEQIERGQEGTRQPCQGCAAFCAKSPGQVTLISDISSFPPNR
jgi:hypothetical protein